MSTGKIFVTEEEKKDCPKFSRAIIGFCPIIGWTKFSDKNRIAVPIEATHLSWISSGSFFTHPRPPHITAYLGVHFSKILIPDYLPPVSGINFGLSYSIGRFVINFEINLLVKNYGKLGKKLNSCLSESRVSLFSVINVCFTDCR